MSWEAAKADLLKVEHDTGAALVKVVALTLAPMGLAATLVVAGGQAGGAALAVGAVVVCVVAFVIAVRRRIWENIPAAPALVAGAAAVLLYRSSGIAAAILVVALQLALSAYCVSRVVQRNKALEEANADLPTG